MTLRHKAWAAANGAVGRRLPVRRIHQVVPMAVPGDATTDHALEVRSLLRHMGYQSSIFASAIHDDLLDEVHLMHAFPEATWPSTMILYQLSSASPLADWARARREPLAVNYHNLTPAESFVPWEPAIAADQRRGRRQMAALAARAQVGIGDSAFNAAELLAHGYRRCEVVPILLDTSRFDADPDPVVAAQLAQQRQRGGTHWLFVGRVAPHKAQHRLVQALALYRRVYDPDARLTIVGRPGSMRYAEALRHLVDELGLVGAVRMPGGVAHRALVAYYRDADVFVSASAHEGFCVPLLEAMHHRLPIVASAAAAVPETLGPGAGVLVEDASPEALCAAVHHVHAHERVRAALVAAGSARLAVFSLGRSRSAMQAAVESWVAER